MAQNICHHCPDFEDNFEFLTSVKDKILYFEQPVCQRCDQPFCEKHSAMYNQFSQIDYDCCIRCQESIENREFERENRK